MILNYGTELVGINCHEKLGSTSIKILEEHFDMNRYEEDESYDEISDYNERFNVAMNEVEKFCKLDYDVKMEKYLKSFDNILHNQKIYLEIFEGIKDLLPHPKDRGQPTMEDWFNYYVKDEII